MAYHPEELADIEAQHKEGRPMPFVEFPLIGGDYILRFIGRDGKYVCEVDLIEATSILKNINMAWQAK